MSRRARPKGPPTCNRGCRQIVVWFGSPFGHGMRPFDPTPIDGRRVPSGVIAYPVFGNQAWKVDALVEHLMVHRDCSRAEAAEEAHAVAWHRVHTCPPEQPPAPVDTGAEFRQLAAVDWTVTSDSDTIHGLDDETGVASDEEWRITDGRFLCGRTYRFAYIPGITARIAAPRCSTCCDVAGLPHGTGSPKNMGGTTR